MPTLEERVKSATHLSMNLGLLQLGEKLDIRVVTMMIWQSRQHPEVVEAISDILASEVAKKEVFNGIEFYLPQLAHMMIHLDVEWPNHVLEQFAYMVSQHSIHFALQLHWHLLCSLQDSQPENQDGSKNPGADPELFIRSATLMHGLERAIVYGNGTNLGLEQRYHDGEITKEQLDKLRNIDRMDNAEKIVKFAETEKPVMKGRLMHISPPAKGPKAVIGKKWKELNMELRFNMLLFYRGNGSLKRALPLHNMIVLDPEDDEITEDERKELQALNPNPEKFKHFFEVREKNRDRVYKFRAVNKTQRKKWVRLLRAGANKPPQYQPAKITIDELSEKQVARFEFFRGQLDFVRDISDICKDVSLLESEDQQLRTLRDEMTTLEIGEMVYNPLQRSSDVFSQIKATFEDGCFVFPTTHGCPCLMTFDVERNAQNLDMANVLHDKFNDEIVAGFVESFTHNILAPMRSVLSREETPQMDMLIKRPSVWNEEEDVTALSTAYNLPKIEDKVRIIAKGRDDVRQEAFIMQLLFFLDDVWQKHNLNLKLCPFQILATSNTTGLIEFVQKSLSIHMLKMKAFEKNGREVSLLQGFEVSFGAGLEAAQKRFVETMAGYSVACYILGIKNRHNNNIMLDNVGNIIHVDFGFVLGMAPGKNKVGKTNFSKEVAAFKLTNEMVEAMGGLESENYKYFNQLVIEGFMVARTHADTITTLVDIMGYKSKFPCFNQPGGTERVLKELKERLFVEMPEDRAMKEWEKKVKAARHHKGTIAFENYQKNHNNIYPVL